MTTATNDDIRQLREAIGGTLGTPKSGPPSINPDWREQWPALAEIGLVGFCVPEDRGGSGFEVSAAVATATEFGAALHGSPYAGLTASAHVLAQPREPEMDQLLMALLAGTHVTALGRLDPDGRSARLVDGAPGADSLLLIDSAGQDHLLFTDPSSWTVDETPGQFDVSRRCAHVRVELAHGRRIPHSRNARNLYGLLLAGDSLGGVERMLSRTVNYAKERRAFGRPIGGFQAVQHRLVDHTVRVRGMELVVLEAARLLTSDSPLADRAIAMAELSVSTGAGFILHDLIQLTGAIGFTWEYGLHLYERRANQDARLASNPRASVRRLAETEGWLHAR